MALYEIRVETRKLSKKVYWVVTDDENVAEKWIEKKLQDQIFASQYIPLILSDISTIDHKGIIKQNPPKGVFLKGWETIPTIREIVTKLQTLSMNKNVVLDRILIMIVYMHNNATLKNPNGPLTIKPAGPPVYTSGIPSPVAGMIVVNQQDGSQMVFDGTNWVKI